MAGKTPTLPSLSGGRETFPRLPLQDSGGSETPRRRGDGKVSEKLTSAAALVSSLSSEPESLSSLSESEERPMLEMSRSEACVGLVAFALKTSF
jgi:hypothetical protein